MSVTVWCEACQRPATTPAGEALVVLPVVVAGQPKVPRVVVACASCGVRIEVVASRRFATGLADAGATVTTGPDACAYQHPEGVPGGIGPLTSRDIDRFVARLERM